jgi:LPS-assembly protein
VGNTAFSAGYLYTPATLLPTPERGREEISAGFNTRIGENWRVGGFARYDIEISRPVLYAATAAYEDECFLVEGRFVRNFAEEPTTSRLYPSGTLFLLRVAFKTVGDFGFRAI